MEGVALVDMAKVVIKVAKQMVDRLETSRTLYAISAVKKVILQTVVPKDY